MPAESESLVTREAGPGRHPSHALGSPSARVQGRVAERGRSASRFLPYRGSLGSRASGESVQRVSVIEHWHTSTARSDSRIRHAGYTGGLPVRTADVRTVALAGQNCQVAKGSNFVRSMHATRGARTHDFAPDNLAGDCTHVDGPADNAFIHREISPGG